MSEFRFDATRGIVRHWAAAKRGVHIPLRSDFDPMGVAALLPRVFIVGSDDAGEWTFRLAGSEMYGLYGMELTGHPLSRIWGCEYTRMRASLAEAAACGRPLIIQSTSSSAEGAVFTETVVMPMRSSSEHAEADRLIGLQSFSSPRPWWLASRAITGYEVHSLDIVEDAEARKAEVKRGIETPPLEYHANRARFTVVTGGLAV